MPKSTFAAPRRQRHGDRILQPGATAAETACDHAVAPFDRLARQMDATWGIDRLPELVSPETAAKYGRALGFLNEAIDAADPARTAAAATNCIRGMHAMDAEARAAGHTPPEPRVALIEHDGAVYGLVDDIRDWQAAERAHPGVVIVSARQAVVAWADRSPPEAPRMPPSVIGTAVERQLRDHIPF
jgi:hypothetical protein